MEIDSDTSDSDTSVNLSSNSQQGNNKDGLIHRKPSPRKERDVEPFIINDHWYLNHISILILSGVIVFVILYITSNRTSFVSSNKHIHKLTTIYFLF